MKDKLLKQAKVLREMGYSADALDRQIMRSKREADDETHLARLESLKKVNLINGN